MKFSVTSNINVNAIKNRLINDKAKLYAHERLRMYCDPYVPYRTGHLAGDATVSAEFAKNVKVSSECVHYISPYAVYPYHGVHMNFRTDKHPLATSYWDRAMKVTKGKDLAKDIQKAIASGKLK